jgi:hypothetical protein
MYNYRIRISGYNMPRYITLIHSKQLGKDRFEAIVFKSFEEVIEKRLKKNPKYKVIPISVQLLLDDVIQILGDKGFSFPKYEQELTINDKLTDYLLKKGYN